MSLFGKTFDFEKVINLLNETYDFAKKMFSKTHDFIKMIKLVIENGKV